MDKRLIVKALISLLLVISIRTTCPTGCSTCTNGPCTACTSGYYLPTGSTSCIPCPYMCTTCTSQSSGAPTCSACTAPLILVSGACVPCNVGCTGCHTSASNCTACAPGLKLTTTGGVGSCAVDTSCPYANCLTCATDTDTQTVACVTCANGYFPFFGQCAKCTHPCSLCAVNHITAWTAALNDMVPDIATQLEIDINNPPSDSPAFFNNWDFSTLTVPQKAGWLFVYYIYLSVVNFIPADLKKPLFKAAVTFYQSIQNLPFDQKINRILNQIEAQIFRRFTVQQFLDRASNQAFSSYGICNDCSAGFLFSNNMCTKCPQLCTSCTSNTVCTGCVDGAALQNSLCVPCQASCKTCLLNDKTACTSCYPPLTYMSNECVQCNSPCAKCLIVDSSKCSQCQRPYSTIPAADLTCFFCDQYVCQACKQDATNVCLKCGQGTTLVNGICQACPANCKSCFKVQSTYTCVSCLTGFQLSNNVCSACTLGCEVCSTLSSGSNICIKCSTGLYLQLNSGVCKLCRQNCLECSSLQDCTKWKPGLVQINGYIVPCSFGCVHCATPAICEACAQGFYLSINKCSRCPRNCLSCQSGSACDICKPFHIFQNSECKLSVADNCIADDGASCLTCLEGFSPVSGQVKCEKRCSAGCIQCQTAAICNRCQKGFALLATGQCVKCLGSCSGACDPKDIRVCISCLQGFQLANNQCVRCPFGCSSCMNSQCTNCNDGFYLTTNSTGSLVCLQNCLFPCLECANGVCTKCYSGYAMLGTSVCEPDVSCGNSCPFCPAGSIDNNDGSCTKCTTERCASCISASTCLFCFDGFYLSSNTCINCPLSCKTCLDSVSCQTCTLGYIKQLIYVGPEGISSAIFSKICIACTNNCKTCIAKPDICTSCVDGFHLVGFQCFGNYLVEFVFEVQDTFATFLDQSKSNLFLESVATSLQVSVLDISLKTVASGSTVITGVVKSTSQSQATTLKSSLGSATVTGFTVVARSVSLSYVAPPDSSTIVPIPQNAKLYEEKEKEPQKNGVIVGVIVGIGVVTIFVVFLIYQLVCNRSTVSQRQTLAVKQYSTSQIIMKK